ncbi:MAG: sigma-70 family RNA polymerase sigma factor [Chloroflexota bacterium]
MSDVSQEQAWALRAQRGDQQAFARLVEAFQTPVYNLAYRMLGDRAAAEDAAQETFVRAYTRINSYDPNFKFASWILSIASHYCVDRLRRGRGGALSMEAMETSRWLPDERPQPEERLLSGERSDRIQGALGQLPGPYRLVIVLRYWEGLSYEEIAAATKSTESAVKSRLHRARLVMAELLGGEGEPLAVSEPVARREAQNAMSRVF